jgi:hypothetical protein
MRPRRTRGRRACTLRGPIEHRARPVSAPVHRVFVESRPFARRRVEAVLSGEEPSGERVVHRRVDGVAPGEREVLDVELPVESVVKHLRNDGPRETARVRKGVHIQNLPRCVVRDTPRPDAARFDERSHAVEGALDRRRVVGHVQVVNVDGLRAETLERSRERALHRLGRQAFDRPADAIHAHFRGD